MLVGKVKAYALRIVSMSSIKTSKVNWKVSNLYSYYLTLPFYNFYNYNPISTESEKYLMIANKTSYHTN